MDTTSQPREAPGVDRKIYPMPMFVTLPVRDLAVSTAFYEAAGFVVLATMPGPQGPDGPPGLVHLRRQRYQDLLLVPGEAVPGPAITVTAGGEDVDARAAVLADHVRRTGRGAVADPADTPWFTRDVAMSDPDGHRLVLSAPRHAEIAQDVDWNRTVREAVGRRPG